MPAAAQYANSRFSNGPTHTDMTAQALGLPLSPSIKRSLTSIFLSACTAIAAQASVVTAQFNAQLGAALNGIGGAQIIQVDIFPPFQQVGADLARYDLTNVTTA